MVERTGTQDERWAKVDDYVVDKLFGHDPRLTATLEANAAAGRPEIDVSATQGKMLYLFARMVGARRILEIGTLGGYSTIWLARALPDEGELVTLEIDPHHADVARRNIAAAGLGERVDVMTRPAIDSLRSLQGPFDLIFIDADKPSNVAYLGEALRLSKPDTVIIADNVVREGQILDSDSTDDRVKGTRALFEAVGREPRLDATAIQTVGSKKWDGFLLAVVR